MELRPYQERAVASVVTALRDRPEEPTLLVAPTGAGKTILLAAVSAEIGGRILILQHRDELVAQNRAKFARYNRGAPTSVYSAKEKRFAPHIGPLSATFAMVPTLCRNLQRMQPVDVVMIDEAHHVMAATWRATLDRARELNPGVKIFGVTATPNRADKQGLGAVFKSVADQIGICELIDSGFLVMPKAHRVGAEFGDYLKGVRKVGGEYDMNQVAAKLDHSQVTQAVISEWRALAGERQTIVFCATVAHARHVAAEFVAAGVRAGVVTGEDDLTERRGVLAALARRELQVVVNVMALTEGFDDQLISCVVLLRPSCFASTVVQMIGRGLRTVDPEIHPTAPPKADCLVLDFGSSLEKLGGLEQVLDLGSGKKREPRQPGPPPMKPCPECRRAIPMSARECVLCGYEYPPEPTQQKAIDVTTIKLVPYDLLIATSKFAWIDLPGPDCRARGGTKVAQGGRCWAFVTRFGSVWYAFGAPETQPRAPRYLASGTLDEAVASADAFLSKEGDASKFGRGSFYMRQAPSTEQRDLARARGLKLRDGATMYEAMCMLSADLNRNALRLAMSDVMDARGDNIAADALRSAALRGAA